MKHFDGILTPEIMAVYRALGSMGGKKGWRNRTEAQKKAHIDNLVSKRKLYWQSLSEEEREAKILHMVQARQRNRRRRKLGLPIDK